MYTPKSLLSRGQPGGQARCPAPTLASTTLPLSIFLPLHLAPNSFSLSVSRQNCTTPCHCAQLRSATRPQANSQSCRRSVATSADPHPGLSARELPCVPPEPLVLSLHAFPLFLPDLSSRPPSTLQWFLNRTRLLRASQRSMTRKSRTSQAMSTTTQLTPISL